MLTRSPEVSTVPEGEALKAVRHELIGALLSHDVHSAYGMSRAAFRDYMPDLLPQPAGYRGYFNRPLLMVPFQITDLPNLINTGDLARLKSLQNTTPVPAKPYFAWVHDGSKYAGFSSEQVTRMFQGDEIASPVIELVYLALEYPEVFLNAAILAPGTSGKSGFLDSLRDGRTDVVPVIFKERGSARLTLSACSPTEIRSKRGILSRGQQINVAA